MAEISTTKTKAGKRRRWVVAVLLLLVAVAWGGMVLVGSGIEQQLVEKLRENGLVMQRTRAVWDPLRGMSFTNVALRTADGKPVAEVGHLEMEIPFLELLGGDEGVSEWRMSHTSVTLHDAAGAVRLDDVSMHLAVRRGMMNVVYVAARKDGLTAALTGRILTRKRQMEGMNGPLVLDLDAVRGTISALEIQQGTGPFHVTGKFRVDVRKQKVSWMADLKGAGEQVEWVGVPLRHAMAEALLTNGESTITADVALRDGTGSVRITRLNWQDKPFLFEGTLVDAKGRTDTFKGSYVDDESALKLALLKGQADLWSLAEGVPALAVMLPDQVVFETFPEVEIKDLVRTRKESGVVWSVDGVEMKGKGVWISKGRQVEVSGLSGGAVYDGRTWVLKDVKARLFGGNVSVDGGIREAKLIDAKVAADQVRLADVKRWVQGEESGSDGRLSINYQGDLDWDARTMDGKGTMRLENAPVIETPLLDETYDLFSGLVSGVERSKTGEFNATFSARDRMVDFQEFEARGGALTVSAKGAVDLKTLQVKGSARGKLGGVPGVVTSPLSRLLEMDVEGLVDDIRVKPLGPLKLVSNTASAVVGSAVELLQEAGKVTGNVLREGAEVLKKENKEGN